MIKCWKICHGDRGSQNDTTFPPIPDQALPLRQRRLRYSMGSVVDSGQYLGGVERPCAGLRRAAGARRERRDPGDGLGRDQHADTRRPYHSKDPRRLPRALGCASRRAAYCRGGPWPCRVTRLQASPTSDKDSRCTKTPAQSCTAPIFFTLLAETYGQAGQPEVGLQVLAEACTLVAETK